MSIFLRFNDSLCYLICVDSFIHYILKTM